CVRVCGEGMDVAALGVQNRGAGSVIAPNQGDHLECEECGMCIDICPVGALTSGAYRYKTRPWEMKHVGTTCTHCGDGCKTTLGVRRADTGMEIVRGDNRDKSGINGDFLCIKGRYAFDFTNHEDRLTQPLIRKDGRLTPASWEDALELAGKRLREVVGGSGKVGVIGSNRITNEENYLLQKFARLALKTNNIDHHRTADFPAFANAVSGKQGSTATMREVASAPAILLIGNDPTEQHPLLAWQIRNNVRLNNARLYVINAKQIKLRRQAAAFVQVSADGGESKAVAFLSGSDSAVNSADREALNALREKLRGEKRLIIAFGSELRGADLAALVKFGSSLTGARYICLSDYANSRGAADMGVYPELLPGYTPLSSAQRFAEAWSERLPSAAGMDIRQMLSTAASGGLQALYVVGSNPVARYGINSLGPAKPFMVVQDLFLTETATLADVVLPAACAYEKSGTFTNTCGDLQQVQKAGDLGPVKPDFEIIVRIADRMGFDIRKLVHFRGGTRADMGQSRGAQSGEADQHAVWLRANNLELKLSPFDPGSITDEIQRLVPGYDVSRIELLAGNDVHTSAPEKSAGGAKLDPETVLPSEDTLFTSGTLGRYSNTLNSVIENRMTADEPVAGD
ncbi:MAG TPA: molybdopterin-dependent oxidoreductase, partial [Terriglobales bacterium]|nr:molybdopterin-dependent oxidoreductase [Terriglobales bacterium]